MKRVKLDVDVDIEKIKQRVLNQYKDDEFFRQVYSELKESNDSLELSDVIEVVENRRVCKNCQGIFECRQKIKGYILSISDNLITQKKCNYLFEKDNIKQKYKNIVYTTFNIDKELPKLGDLEINSARIDILNAIKESTIKKNAKGLFLSGPPGVGKTFILEALLSEYLNENKRCAYVLLTDLSSQLKAMYFSFENEDKDEFNRIILRLKKVDVLVIDDIGAEKIDAFLRDDVLFPILDYRMKNNLLTHFSSNNQMESLKEHFANTSTKLSEPIKANRIMERIKVLANEYILVEKKSRR